MPTIPELLNGHVTFGQLPQPRERPGRQHERIIERILAGDVEFLASRQPPCFPATRPLFYNSEGPRTRDCLQAVARPERLRWPWGLLPRQLAIRLEGRQARAVAVRIGSRPASRERELAPGSGSFWMPPISFFCLDGRAR